MKQIIFIIWLILTIVLTFSIVGLVLFVPKDKFEEGESIPSTWMTIGKALLKSIIETK